MPALTVTWRHVLAYDRGVMRIRSAYVSIINIIEL